jgi:acyl CoA:acetate/3-ketoacid CoA transferase beta subunit
LIVTAVSSTATRDGFVVWVGVVLAALVVDLVPESGRSVQQASKQLLVLAGLGNHNERVGPLHQLLVTPQRT